MTKFIPYIICLLLPLTGWNQTGDSKELKRKWREINEQHGFQKAKDYNGPSADGYVAPTDINESQPITSGSGSSRNTPYKGMPYSSAQQRQGRNPGAQGQGGNGTLQADPNITPPEDIDIPEIDSPDIDAPDIDAPEVSTSFWKILGIILLIILVGIIIYYILKNRQPANPTVPFEPLEEDLNPATISKTELEMRLEEAMQRGDYRECVRIYFLFAMKELIQRRWIFWKKEKTNIHYIIEMQGRKGVREFEEIVGLYDLVWYGDYVIDEAAYNRMQPVLDANYKTIERNA
ncbi:MAG TPA: hypothetical protein VK151_18620 [Fluviicola sp.]|nr:hypothetical protein [Fluviicola sp.]